MRGGCGASGCTVSSQLFFFFFGVCETGLGIEPLSHMKPFLFFVLRETLATVQAGLELVNPSASVSRDASIRGVHQS